MEPVILSPDKALAVARVCYEANRGYCETLNDHSFRPWDEAPCWQQDSVINGVLFHAANPDAGPKASHENWLAEKWAAGWKYGPVKDPAAKEHPCFVPFDQLPPEQQLKNVLFRAVVHALLFGGE